MLDNKISIDEITSLDTIAAIATPLAVGGISVIRISGNDAITVADRVFKSFSKELLKDKNGYTAAYGYIEYNNKQIDTSVALVFKAPKSYTGENVVELSCHGGIYITREVLHAVLDNGARLAEPGEFTKRAFLNGKMSLTQAEAVIDIINSKNSQALNAAKSELDGALYKKIKTINADLLNIAGHLGAWVDYPEEDIPVVEEENLLNSLNNANSVLENLLANYEVGKIIKEGIDTVIVGKPNVGKSTLMNLLSGCEKSIVTEIAGTTRDVVEESVNLGDVILKLSDTAGIRETQDIVEQFGVKIARKRLEQAQLILAVFDNSGMLDNQDKEIIEQIKNKNAIAIINKTDLESKIDVDFIKENIDNVIFISAKEASIEDKNNDLFKIKSAIKELINISDIDLSAGIIANERQRQACVMAHDYLKESIDSINMGMTLDAVTVSIEMAIECLLKLTGEKITEEVVNKVFSNFCVGK